MADKIWLIWNPNGGAPTHPHHDEHSAKVEAERLARSHPGHRFIVLESVAECRKREVTWERHERSGPDDRPMDTDDLPF